MTDRFAHFGLCLLVTLFAACDDGAKSSPSDAANTDEVSEVADDLGTDASEVEGCGDGVCADTETSETAVSGQRQARANSMWRNTSAAFAVVVVTRK